MAPGSRLVRAWPLAGGVSAQVTALELADLQGALHRVVVRRYGAADHRANPRVADLELAVLRRVSAAGLPVPAPHFAGAAGTLFPEPYLVIDYVDGAPDLPPAGRPAALDQLAAFLARLHALAGDTPDLGPLPRAAVALEQRLAHPPPALDQALSEARVRAALARALPRLRAGPVRLLHGDFWPGNALWQGGRLAAVLDWEDAQVGDPLADLGNARLELLWAWGRAALADFTARYAARAAVDAGRLAGWDLAAALRPAGKLAGWGLPEAVEQQMQADHAWFVDQALARLGAG